MIIRLATALAVMMTAFPVQAAGTSHSHVSKYAGEESRAIKSLSAGDIAELKRGGGWGLAKSAELNGVPGPAHLLEMKEEIPLDEGQVAAITSLYNDMKTRAMAEGERLISLERELEDHFRDGTIDDAILRASLDAIAEARKTLRYIHLATHLQTPGILSENQIETYNRLRGYAEPDPCAAVPEGHDADMWRRHNGCE